MAIIEKENDVKKEFRNKLLFRWAQRILNNERIPLYDFDDLSIDKLLKITEILSNKINHRADVVLSGANPNKKEVRIQHEKIETLINFISRQAVDLVSLPRADKVLKDKKLYMDILYEIFYHFERFCNKRDRNAKESLFRWVKEYLSDTLYSSFKITDMSDSWKNGKLLCALIHSHNPKCLKIDQIKIQDAESNLRLAIYASNILLNLENLFSFKEFNTSGEPGIMLLVAEFRNAIKIAPKVGPSKEIVINAIEKLTLIDSENKKISKLTKSISEKMNISKKKFEDMINMVKNKKRNEVESENKSMSAAFNLAKEVKRDVIEIEKMRFKNLERVLETRSRKMKATKFSNTESELLLQQYNELFEKQCKIESIIKNDKSSDGLTLQLDDKITKLVTELIRYVEYIRKKMAKKSKSKTREEIINEINYHKSLNLDINLKKKYYRGQISLIEKELKDKIFPSLERTEDRINMDMMFDIVAKEWLQKLSILRQLEEHIKKDAKILELNTILDLLYDRIEERGNEFLKQICGKFESESIEEARMLNMRLQVKKNRLDQLEKSDLKKMKKIINDIEGLTKNSLKIKKIDEKVYNEKLTKSQKIQETVNMKYLEGKKRIESLLSRELFKQKVKLLIRTHEENSQTLILWCEQKIKEAQNYTINVDSLKDTYEELSNTMALKDILKHEMDESLAYLKKISDKIITASYPSFSHPEYCYKFDEASEEALLICKRQKKVVLAFSRLTEFIYDRIGYIEDRLRDFEHIFDQRIKISAMVDEYTLYIDECSKNVRDTSFTRKNNTSELSLSLKSFDKNTHVYKGRAQTLRDDVAKIYSKCMKENTIKELSPMLMEKLDSIYVDFELLIKVSRDRLVKEGEKINELDSRCKDYAELSRKTIQRVQKLHLQLFEQNTNGLNVSEKNVEELKQYSKKLSNLKNKLYELEIRQNPHPALDFEEVQNWCNTVIEEILKVERIRNRAFLYKKLNNFENSEIETLHRNYSKHFDSRKNSYLNRESFISCMKDQNIYFSEKEVSEIFQKHGIRSKKEPGVRLIGIKKFIFFINHIGRELGKKNVSYSLSAINNGNPFITKNQVDRIFSLDGLKYFSDEITKRNDQREENLFFNDWLDEIYGSSDTEEGNIFE